VAGDTLFSEAERAALVLTDALSHPADRPDPVPDEVWKAATDHLEPRVLAALLLQIGAFNVWNRLNAAVPAR